MCCYLASIVQQHSTPCPVPCLQLHGFGLAGVMVLAADGEEDGGCGLTEEMMGSKQGDETLAMPPPEGAPVCCVSGQRMSALQ